MERTFFPSSLPFPLHREYSDWYDSFIGIISISSMEALYDSFSGIISSSNNNNSKWGWYASHRDASTAELS